jgi:hypothetical protein
MGEHELSVSPAYEDANGQLITYEPVVIKTAVIAAAKPVPSDADRPVPSDFSLGGLAESIPAPVILTASILCAAMLAAMFLMGRRKR